MKIHMAFQMDGSGQKFASRNHNVSTTLGGASINRPGDGRRGIRIGARDGSEIRDHKILRRKSGRDDPLQYFRHLIPSQGCGRKTKGRSQTGDDKSYSSVHEWNRCNIPPINGLSLRETALRCEKSELVSKILGSKALRFFRQARNLGVI